MRRMIISGIIGLFDLAGYINTVEDLQYFKNTGIYPTPNIGLDLTQQLIVEFIIIAVCAFTFAFGLFANKYNR